MSYYQKEELQTVRKIDLLTFLQQNAPQEIIRVAGNTYCTREHDSLKISNGKWCWFSRGIGGRSALDYLIKVKGIPFTEAVGMILGGCKKTALKKNKVSSEWRDLVLSFHMQLRDALE